MKQNDIKTAYYEKNKFLFALRLQCGIIMENGLSPRFPASDLFIAFVP